MGQVVSIQKPLETLVLEIRSHVHDAGRAETTCAKHQLQAGWRLLALRERVEAGEAGQISWWEYFDTQFTGHIKSRKYAERLMKWAKSDDPEAAREIDLEAKREQMRESRKAEKLGAHVGSNTDDREDYDIVSHALSLVGKMDEAQRENFHQEYMEKFQ
jgi:hypothetical protein